MDEQVRRSYLLSDELVWEILVILLETDGFITDEMNDEKNKASANIDSFLVLARNRILLRHILMKLREVMGTGELSDKEKADLQQLRERLEKDGA